MDIEDGDIKLGGGQKNGISDENPDERERERHKWMVK